MGKVGTNVITIVEAPPPVPIMMGVRQNAWAAYAYDADGAYMETLGSLSTGISFGEGDGNERAARTAINWGNRLVAYWESRSGRASVFVWDVTAGTWAEHSLILEAGDLVQTNSGILNAYSPHGPMFLGYTLIRDGGDGNTYYVLMEVAVSGVTIIREESTSVGSSLRCVGMTENHAYFKGSSGALFQVALDTGDISTSISYSAGAGDPPSGSSVAAKGDVGWFTSAASVSGNQLAYGELAGSTFTRSTNDASGDGVPSDPTQDYTVSLNTAKDKLGLFRFDGLQVRPFVAVTGDVSHTSDTPVIALTGSPGTPDAFCIGDLT